MPNRTRLAPSSLTTASIAVASLASTLVGCASTLPAVQAERATTVAAGKTTRIEARSASEDIAVELTPDPRKESVEVRIVVRNAPQHFAIVDVRAVTLGAMAAHDASGPVEVESQPSKDGQGVELHLARPAQGALELHYAVSPSTTATRTDGDCPFLVEPDRAVFCGESTVAIPMDDGAARSTRLVLRADPELLHDAASSFGLADDLVTQARPEDLAHAAYVFGDLGTAELHATEAHDHAAWLGYTSFDPRWVAAESAGVRTATDRWFDIQRPRTDPSVGIILVAGKHPEQPLRIGRRTRGLFVTADLSTTWTGQARIHTAQIFAQRTVGGALWMGSRDAKGEASGAWFSEGVSRTIAVDVLRDLEVLTPDEQAADVNSLLVEEAFGTSRDLGVEALGTKSMSGDPHDREEARRALAVRGALLGVMVGPERLKKIVRGLVKTAAESHADNLSLATFVSAVERDAGSDAAKNVGRLLDRGGEVPIPKNALGVCFELTKKTVAPFELGFEIQSKEGTDVVSHVQPDSAAAKAGVVEGDHIVSLAYQPGRPDIAAELKVHRDTGDVAMKFLPAGVARRGRAFVKSHEARCRD